MSAPVQPGQSVFATDSYREGLWSMEATIEVTGLRKRFGATLALDGMSFAVEPGRVTGFVGPNGAGKFHTMRVILALDRPDEARATVGGRAYASLRQPMRVL